MTGIDRFVEDESNTVETYLPYPKQSLYHASPCPYNCLGGAAGPGKTLALIMDHMIVTQEFNASDAPQVHTLMLRRTQPKLRKTLVTRFVEKVPRELYSSFNHSSLEVVWKNGATTQFGSMQHEHNAFDWQGQWLKISYDEMAEFTYKQWSSVSAWNRCPVSPYTTKDGATNPIGVGAGWIRRLFVDKRPCDEMDDAQRALYDPRQYGYFPCTYLDNPVYANDPQFLANLMQYPKAIREALMNGSWDVVGGYFYGAWDPAENVYGHVDDEGTMTGYLQPEPWHRRWISGDWGFEHYSAIYWHYLDDFGVLRTYKERLVKHHDPEMLAELIVKDSRDPDGSMPDFIAFPFSHDAFADQTTKSYGANPNAVASRMSKALKMAGLPQAVNSGKDAIGREQTMYNMLRKRVWGGERGPDSEQVLVPAWQISADCPRLIACIGSAPRDEKRIERIAEFAGDDPLQGAGYGVYYIAGKRAADKPYEVRLAEAIAPIQDFTEKHMAHLAFMRGNKAKAGGFKMRRG